MLKDAYEDCSLVEATHFRIKTHPDRIFGHGEFQKLHMLHGSAERPMGVSLRLEFDRWFYLLATDFPLFGISPLRVRRAEPILASGEAVLTVCKELATINFDKRLAGSKIWISNRKPLTFEEVS